jgi:TATA-box binding protein (TBP) (component of TFIID and TFIIIB)
MVYGTQSIFENANYYGAVSDDYNVLAECYEAIIMFEQNMSDVITAVGSAEIMYLKETGEMRVYTEADKGQLKATITTIIENFKTKICDIIDKVVIWFNQTIVSSMLVKMAEKVDVNKIDPSLEVPTTALMPLDDLTAELPYIKDIAGLVSNGTITTFKEYIEKMAGYSMDDDELAEFISQSNPIYARKEIKKAKKNPDNIEKVSVKENFKDSVQELKNKKYLKFLSDFKAVVKSVKISKDMDENRITEMKKIISYMGKAYSGLIMMVKENILDQTKVVKAGIKSANGKGAATTDTKTQDDNEPEVTTESFLDAYLNK